MTWHRRDLRRWLAFHPAAQGWPGGLLVRRWLGRPQLRGELVHGNVSEDVVYSTHHSCLSARLRGAAPDQIRVMPSDTSTDQSWGHYHCGRPDIRQALGPGWIGLR